MFNKFAKMNDELFRELLSDESISRFGDLKSPSDDEEMNQIWFCERYSIFVAWISQCCRDNLTEL
jgi:hypothetical protein